MTSFILSKFEIPLPPFSGCRSGMHRQVLAVQRDGVHYVLAVERDWAHRVLAVQRDWTHWVLSVHRDWARRVLALQRDWAHHSQFKNTIPEKQRVMVRGIVQP